MTAIGVKCIDILLSKAVINIIIAGNKYILTGAFTRYLTNDMVSISIPHSRAPLSRSSSANAKSRENGLRFQLQRDELKKLLNMEVDGVAVNSILSALSSDGRKREVGASLAGNLHGCDANYLSSDVPRSHLSEIDSIFASESASARENLRSSHNQRTARRSESSERRERGKRRTAAAARSGTGRPRVRRGRRGSARSAE